MSGEAVTPYDGTSGWSGSQASEERAELRDSDGSTADIQTEVQQWVEDQGPFGITIAELREALPGQHHGNLSAALSVLHKVGRIARLEEKRGRCHPYVGLDYVDGRPTAPHGRRRPDAARILQPQEADALASVRQRLAAVPVWPEVSVLEVPVDVLRVLVATIERRTGLDA